MDTITEALFRAMFASDWYDKVGTNARGDVFGAISIKTDMLDGVVSEHRDAINAYGGLHDPGALVGHWFVRKNSDGMVFATKEHRGDTVARMFSEAEDD